MKADGSDARRLTQSPGRDAHPTFLPNGQIVFQSPRDYADPNEVDLYLMEFDGSTQRRLVAASGFDGVPVPSRNGRQIAFQRGRPTGPGSGGPQWDLYLVDSSGLNETRLTAERWSSQVPSWSPDGERILFFANPADTNHLFVLTRSTRTVTPLPAPPRGEDNAGAFSPDGRRIAFTSTRDGRSDLYLMDADGRNVVRLTTDLEVQGQPSWSSNGRRLLFAAAATGQNDVYVIGVDGTGLKRLTHGTEGAR